MSTEDAAVVRLHMLVMENFKSYKGKVVIGPLRDFTAVIGPNGSGKSNFMDAISFVFGEQARSLRVKKLNELIHGSNVNDPAASKCSVTAVMTVGEEVRKFKRIVKMSGNEAVSDFRVDGKSVSSKQYMEALASYNVIVKPRNFLVFQGQVEQIATMNPKQRTILLEQISGSGDLKDDFDRLEKELEAANEEMRKAFTKKKEMDLEEKEAKEDKKLADEHQRYQKELESEKVQVELFELFHKDRGMEEIGKGVRLLKEKTRLLTEEKERSETEMKSAKKKLGKTTEAITRLDQETRTAGVKVSQIKPEYLRICAEISHLEAKIEKEERMLVALTETRKKHEETIASLNKEKKEVNAAQLDFSQTQTEEMEGVTQLSATQSAEYYQLKQEAHHKMAALTQEMESVTRDWLKHKEILSAETFSLEEVKKELERQRKEEHLLTGRIDRLEELKRKSKEEKTSLRKSCEELEESLAGLDERVSDVTDRLRDISRQWGDVQMDQRDLVRRSKKEELVKKLKQLYGDDVYGRLVDVCHHAHERYQLAVTKILSAHMNGIIVSDTSVALHCISYIRQQELEPEQFLPLNSLTLKPLAEHLRQLAPDQVKLVVDCIQITHCDKSAVQKAVRFACGNALTCEDVNRARSLAYAREPLQVVTWSGTLFSKSGTISGGAADLKVKARRWEEKDMLKLKAEQTQLEEALRILMHTRRKESDVTALHSKLEGLNARINFAEKERKESVNSLNEIEKQIADLLAKEIVLTSRVTSAEVTAKKWERKKQNLEKKMENLEDEIFSEFCRKINVLNIRKYETKEMKEEEEKGKKLMEFQKQISKIEQTLTYQKSALHSAIEKVERCEKASAVSKKTLKIAKQNEMAKKIELGKAEAAQTVLIAKRGVLQTKREEEVADVTEKEKVVSDLKKKLEILLKEVQIEESKREQLKLERRAVLQHCKLHNIALLFERGSMEDVALLMGGALNDLTLSTQTNSAHSSFHRGESGGSGRSSQTIEGAEEEIKLDYSQLPDRLKRKMDSGEFSKELERLLEHVKELEMNIDRLSVPKSDIRQRLTEIKKNVRQMSVCLDQARQTVMKVTKEFEDVRRERQKRFSDCLDTVSRSIDQIYKELVHEESAQAFLNVENSENPFKGGIVYSLVVPGKNFRQIDSLSGGEKTLASLSLLFAIHAAQPSPFFILDEVDAALDNTNIFRVAKFIREKSRNDFQIIIISLKEEMYNHADALVGIYPEPADICISRNLTLDLNQYDHLHREKSHR